MGERSVSSETSSPKEKPPTVYGFYLAGIGVVAVAIGLWRLVLAAWNPELLNFTTLGFLLAPMVVGLLSNASEVTFGADGVSWKKEVTSKLDSTDASVRDLNALVEQLKTITASGVGGRRPAQQTSSDGLAVPLYVPRSLAPLIPERAVQEAPTTALATDPADPQKGRWGGQAARDHRRLVGTVDVLKDDPTMFEVKLAVESSDPVNHPLTGSVRFHLHDTFDPDTVRSTVRNGAARLIRYAWGAFTVGAEVDGGRTCLELDLAELADAPRAFKEN